MIAGGRMRRRQLLAVFGTALSVPLQLAFAEAAGKRSIGALFSQAQGDSEGLARMAAFRQGLATLGWTEAQNIGIDVRWSGGSTDHMQSLAADLVARRPEVILAAATTALASLKRVTSTVPIVFAQVIDPVGAGFVQSLARPGGNITGLTQHEFAIAEKWLELLKQVAPHLTRAGVLYPAANPASDGYLRVITAVARSMQMQVLPIPIRDPAGIARAIDDFARAGGGGLLLLPGPAGTANRALIISLAERHHLPTVFAFRYHVVSGGLMSYGIDNIDLYRRAAWYVDRILKGANPSELPVEHASKFQLVINAKTAKALGLAIPLSLLTSDDEVIE
jgi:putative tryptophan/tyrosine transport system substrate-binding protein